MDKLTLKHRKLLQILLNTDKILSSKELSFETKISVRTVKTYIKIINNSISKYGVNIKTIYSKGYKLEYIDIKNLEYIKQKNIFIDESYVNEYVQERVYTILKMLILKNSYVHINDILDELNISIHTFNKDILVVKEKINIYRLKLETKLNYISIVGSEMDIRLFLNDFIYYDNKKDLYEFKEYLKYRIDYSIIEEVFNKFNIIMSGVSIKNLIYHIEIGLTRYILGNEIILYQYENRWKLVDDKSIYFELAKELAMQIEKNYNICLNYAEIMYYALHFKCKVIDNKNIYDNIVDFCIDESFKEIKNNFNIDFSEDIELYNSLKNHIPLMVIRIKSHIIFRNNIVSENLRKYLFATKITHTVSHIIEKNYNIEVDINEFGHLVLYFQKSLMEINKKNRINIGIFNDNSLDEIMYFNTIFNDIDLMKKYNIKNINEDSIENNDFLIGTTNKVSKYNKNYFIINSDDYLEKLKIKLDNLYKNNFNIEKYFKKEYFLSNLNIDNKNDVIKYIIEYLKNNNILKPNLNYNVSFKSAELGREVVHLQDLYKIVDKNICLIVILKRSIFWQQSTARIIILTKTKRDGDKDLYRICDMISKFVSKNENIINLIENQNFKNFLEKIKSDR